MLALVVDTSSAAVTAGIADIAAGRQPQVLAGRVTVDARAHAELLSPAIAECLAECGLAPGDLDAVIAGCGPGPFTGLRVGLMTAAAFCDALGIPGYGVCSLDAIADAHVGTVLVAGDARRREVYWAVYADGVRTAGPAVHRPAEVPAGPVDAVCGAGARLYEAEFAASQFPAPFLDRDYPTGLAACAAPRVLAGAPGEALTPLYLRRPDAVVPGARKQATG